MLNCSYKLTTLEQVARTYSADLPVMFDIETDGLYGRIVLAQFYQPHQHLPDTALVVKDPNPRKLATLVEHLNVVGYNISYEVATIQAQLGEGFIPDLAKFEDAFLLAKLEYYLMQEFSLDKVVEYTYGYDVYAAHGIDKKVMHKAKWGDDLNHAQLTYAAIDVVALQEVYDRVAGRRDDTSYKLDKTTLHYCMQFQTNGMPVLMDKLNAMRERNNIRIDEIALPVNANSYKQVRKYIGEEESDALALARFAIEGNTRAAAVKETRGLLKTNSFLDKFTTRDHRIYGKFIPSTRSGRLASTDQNLQQIPRNTKGLFGFPENGQKVLIYSDFAQLELRCAAAVAGETHMEKLFNEGKDLHGYTAEMIFGKDYTPEHRQIAKTANFNLLYGGGAGMLGSILIKTAELRVPEDELYEIKRKWLSLWPKLAAWQQRGIKAHQAGKEWSTPLGRKYIGKLMTDQLNIAVQGHGADVAKLALHFMMQKLHSPQVRLLNFIHDSYIFECPNEPAVYEQVAKVVGDSMQEAWNELSKLTRIKTINMPVSVAVGFNWKELESDNAIYTYEV